jgi:hypothetical protein
VAADLRGDLLGTQAVVASDRRWLTPLPLWTGILAGPIAWALDLCVSYALVKWTCSSQRTLLMHLISPACLALVMGGAAASWFALRATGAHVPTDTADLNARARFMAVLGLTSSALFALTVVAGAIPRWVLDACR